MIEKKPTYFHPARIRAVVQVLQLIFEEGKYADKAIGYVLKNNPKAGSQDRAFIAEHSYEVVRYFRFYYTWLGRVPNCEPDWWSILGIYFMHRGHVLPNFVEFEGIVEHFERNQTLNSLKERAVKESIPDWLDQVGAAELGDAWPATVVALNKPAEVVLRANTLVTTQKELAEMLKAEHIETISIPDSDALKLVVRSNIFTTKAFKGGLFEVQDLSSQQVAPFLQVQPGQKVVDACAGGGGKTLHLAALMQNKGTITAMDTFEWKLNEIKTRARRAGVHNIRTQLIDNTKAIKRLHGTADRVLLDVPCSGLGVLRRNPDAKWKLSEEFLDNLRITQTQILSDYASMCKPTGLLVYATCSILPSENTKQVHAFLESEPGKRFTLQAERSIAPQEGFDGFYMARMVCC
jgi:16S rRNA (cytosine967-C5)-methyltransferase